MSSSPNGPGKVNHTILGRVEEYLPAVSGQRVVSDSFSPLLLTSHTTVVTQGVGEGLSGTTGSRSGAPDKFGETFGSGKFGPSELSHI